MHLRSLIFVAVAVALLFGVTALAPRGTASAAIATPPTFGTLSNFDVFNDTGQVTRGFEIELEGISVSNVTYEFGAPYERYGNPTVVPYAGGVRVLYRSPWDSVAKAFTQGTPVPPVIPAATGGHECWTGGSPTYPTEGCEHFGLALTANPTNVNYYWLVASPTTPGTLVTYGTGVPMPAPLWSATPPAPNNPNPAPVVAAAVAAPEPDPGQQLGDAVWVKVYTLESALPAQLGHLVSGDLKVPDAPGELETEWLLIQNGAGGGLQAELKSEGQMGKSSESVTRRYQFFAYTGAYDPENHEALVANDSKPSPGELGPLIGNNMGALNLAKGGQIPGDVIRPKVMLLMRPALTTVLHSATFRMTATDNVSKTFGYYCSLDKKIPSKCTAKVILTGLKKGRHTFKGYAVDGARNASIAIGYAWTIR